jgi:hypothetical protein
MMFAVAFAPCDYSPFSIKVYTTSLRGRQGLLNKFLGNS